MKQLELHMRNGQTITVDATEVTTRYTSGRLSNFEWITPEKRRRRLMFAEVDEIIAVVAIS